MVAHSATGIIVGKGTGVQILDKGVCDSFRTDTLRKDMNPSLLPVIGNGEEESLWSWQATSLAERQL